MLFKIVYIVFSIAMSLGILGLGYLFYSESKKLDKEYFDFLNKHKGK